MYTIRYYYSSLSKQAFLIITIWYLLARMGIFYVAGFSQYYYTLPSMLMYLALIGFCVLCFIGFKLYYVEFDETKATAYNKLFKKTRTIALKDIKKATFTRTRIGLYTDDSDKPTMKIPLYFFGKISPVGAENFEIMLKNQGVPRVSKTYKTLPGFGRFSTIISYTFFFLCIPFLLTTIQLIEIIIMILRGM